MAVDPDFQAEFDADLAAYFPSGDLADLKFHDAQHLVNQWPKEFAFVSNTQVDRSRQYGHPADEVNYNFWLEMYESTQDQSWRDFRDRGIFVWIDKLSTDEKESYEYLEDSYVIDDDALSNLENELQHEAYDDYGRADFRKSLIENLVDSDEEEKLDEFLDAMGDEALDSVYYEAARRAEAWPEMGQGYEVILPDPEKIWFPNRVYVHNVMSTSDPNYSTSTDDDLSRHYRWDQTFLGFIHWIGIGQEAVVQLSPKAFCRLPPEDQELGYPGAKYIRYGEEWVLNIDMDRVGGPASAFADLIRRHADDSATFVGADQAPSVTVPYNRSLYESDEAPYLDVRLKLIEDSQRKKIHGPGGAWTEDQEISPEEVAAQQKFDAAAAKLHDVAVDAQFDCNFEPTEDLSAEVVAQLLLEFDPETFDKSWQFDKTQRVKEEACKITQQILDKRPAFCTFRQLKFPFASEAQKKKHQKHQKRGRK